MSLHIVNGQNKFKYVVHMSLYRKTTVFSDEDIFTSTLEGRIKNTILERK